jgi:hypothetical protein
MNRISLSPLPEHRIQNAVVLTPAMRAATTKRPPERLSDLPDSTRVLALTMHHVRFGRFEDLVVRNGKPVFNPPPSLIRVSRIGGAASENSDLRPEDGDWALTSHLVELVEELDRIGDGVVSRLEFRNGLPVLVEVQLPAQSVSESTLEKGHSD